MSSNRPNLTLDEKSFEGLLSAAFTIQEHNDRQKRELQTHSSSQSPTETESGAVCRHCGARKSSESSRCENCGVDEFRPGERLQRNWASMWLRSQGQWPANSAEIGPTPRNGSHSEADGLAAEDAATNHAGERSSFPAQQPPARDRVQSLSNSDWPNAYPDVNEDPAAEYETSASPTIDGEEFDPSFEQASALAKAQPSMVADSWFRRVSDWQLKLRFRRADLYLGVSIFVAAAALLWPSAVPSRPAALDPWERALVMLGIAEAPAPLVRLQGDPAVEVWIDPHTALYYCSGDEQFQKTEGGRFSSQREAQMDRFEPASRSACE